MISFLWRIHFLYYFSYTITNKYPTSSIRILSWLHYPNILRNRNSINLFIILFFFRVIFIILFAFFLSSSFLFPLQLYNFLLFFYLNLIEVLDKNLKFRIFQTTLNVESQRQDIKGVSSHELIVLGHIPKKSLFIA